MYHFTCPDPVAHPLKLEFVELYQNEAVYWAHAKSPSFGSAFFNAFKDENRKSRAFITVGEKLSQQVRRVNAALDSTFPETQAGYLLHAQHLKALDYADHTRLMCKLQVTVPDYHRGNKEVAQEIRNMVAKLSEHASEAFAVMFHLHCVCDKVYPDKLELVSVWPNAQCL